MEFLIFDSKIHAENEINLTRIYRDETFRIPQKIWFGFGGIPLFEENIGLLTEQISKLNLQGPKELNNLRELFRITKRMLNKNKFYRSGYIQFTLIWNKNQEYLVITSEARQLSEFPFRKQGLLLNKSSQKKHTQNIFNIYPFFNHTMWNVALNEVRNTSFQNSVITNENDFVCECAFNNIYLIKGNKLLTPSLKTGCADDVTRDIILKIAPDIKLKAEETDKLKISDLPDMDEIFLASEENGVQWILGIENKRFVHHFSIVIHRKLNEYLEEKVR
jgi:branched-chain amino acid aminotransferase